MRVPALAKLHEIFLSQGGGPFELVAGKHYLCDTANAEIQKDASLAYKITRISLVPLMARAPDTRDRTQEHTIVCRPNRGYEVPSKWQRAKT
jgi:hypothetical protein